MKFYILHEPGKSVNPLILTRAGGLSNMLATFYLRTSGGVMKVVPSGSDKPVAGSR